MVTAKILHVYVSWSIYVCECYKYHLKEKNNFGELDCWILLKSCNKHLIRFYYTFIFDWNLFNCLGFKLTLLFLNLYFLVIEWNVYLMYILYLIQQNKKALKKKNSYQHIQQYITWPLYALVFIFFWSLRTGFTVKNT